MKGSSRLLETGGFRSASHDLRRCQESDDHDKNNRVERNFSGSIAWADGDDPPSRAARLSSLLRAATTLSPAESRTARAASHRRPTPTERPGENRRHARDQASKRARGKAYAARAGGKARGKRPLPARGSTT
jgi:hypothetical protein